MLQEESPEQGSRVAQIAHLNDAFRRSNQGIMITPGVQALPDVLGLVRAVQAFVRFTPDAEPSWDHRLTLPKVEEIIYQGTDGGSFGSSLSKYIYCNVTIISISP